MFWIISCLLMNQPAQAESPHIPEEVKEKLSEARKLLGKGAHSAKETWMEFEQGSGVGNWISNTASDAWTGVKAKGKGALIYLDQNFHEHILAPENDSGRKRK